MDNYQPSLEELSWRTDRRTDGWSTAFVMICHAKSRKGEPLSFSHSFDKQKVLFSINLLSGPEKSSTDGRTDPIRPSNFDGFEPSVELRRIPSVPRTSTDPIRTSNFDGSHPSKFNRTILSLKRRTDFIRPIRRVKPLFFDRTAFLWKRNVYSQNTLWQKPWLSSHSWESNFAVECPSRSCLNDNSYPNLLTLKWALLCDVMWGR